MPTFRDPLTDAAEASEAMRGLAHASRVFDDPADTYTVFGDLTATMRSLRQVLDPVSYTHLDVYKRQFQRCWLPGWIPLSPSEQNSDTPPTVKISRLLYNFEFGQKH